MNLEQKIKFVFEESKTDNLEKINEIAALGDYLRYSDDDQATTVSYLNLLIKYLVKQTDDHAKEEILGIILDTEDAKNVDKEVDVEPIAENISIFNVNCLSYILSIFGYSGKEEYRSLIEKYRDVPELEEDVEDALLELNYRQKNS